MCLFLLLQDLQVLVGLQVNLDQTVKDCSQGLVEILVVLDQTEIQVRLSFRLNKV